MSMSTHVVGFKPPDETFKRNLAAYRACQAAHIKIPPELESFFDYSSPDDNGVSMDIEDKSKAVSIWSAECAAGFEVDLRMLDPAIKIIRFYNSY